MEVFLFVSSDDQMPLLESTMLAWEEIDYAFPVNVVQLPEHRFEVKRRVLADEMASSSHYVLADLGCIPEDRRALLGAVSKLGPKEGLVYFSGESRNKIRICRKGVVPKWPEQTTACYEDEHKAAVKAAGYEVCHWATTYKPILGC